MHSPVKTPTQLEDGVLPPTFENTVRGKKAYFSQRSSLTPPASISQVITSLTLIFTLNQNTLMRIRAFLAKMSVILETTSPNSIAAARLWIN